MCTTTSQAPRTGQSCRCPNLQKEDLPYRRNHSRGYCYPLPRQSLCQHQLLEHQYIVCTESTQVMLSQFYLHPILPAGNWCHTPVHNWKISNLEISAGKRSTGCNEHWKQTIQPSARAHWSLPELLHRAKTSLLQVQRCHCQGQQQTEQSQCWWPQTLDF